MCDLGQDLSPSLRPPTVGVQAGCPALLFSPAMAFCDPMVLLLTPRAGGEALPGSYSGTKKANSRFVCDTESEQVALGKAGHTQLITVII